MAEGRIRERWTHTSAVLALLANIHRDRRKRPTPYKPADFDPYHHRQQQAHKVSIDILKQVFVDRDWNWR